MNKKECDNLGCKDDYKDFFECVGNAVCKFNSINGAETIRIISHIDADGISCACIMIKALTRSKRKFSLTFVSVLTEKIIASLAKEPYNYFVFCDMGTSHCGAIRKYMCGKNVFILDHHKPKYKKKGEDPENIQHLNPELYGIDGTKETSAAGVAYFFAKEMSQMNKELAYIAVLGAIGDCQEDNGFSGLNDMILSDAKDSKKIIIEKGLRFFGRDNKPLYKLLKSGIDIYIPDVTDDQEKSVDFLESLNIPAKENGKWRKINDLSEEELNRLIEKILFVRKKNEKKEDIYGNIYRLDIGAGKATCDFNSDLKELAMILNACGRLGKAYIGVGLLLGDKKSSLNAVYALKEYKKEIMNAMKWYEKNKSSNSITREKGYIIINGRDNISFSVISPVSSLFSKTKIFPEGTFIIIMARTLDNETKISMRIAGNCPEHVSLYAILESIIEKIGGEYGGHTNAAGALIDMKKEKDFIELAKCILSKKIIEEVVE